MKASDGYTDNAQSVSMRGAKKEERRRAHQDRRQVQLGYLLPVLKLKKGQTQR